MNAMVKLKPLGYLIVLLLIFGCSDQKGAKEAEILDTFSIAEGFKMELVAMEPLISDPVAMEIDENGNVYVVEMHGYPLDADGSGVIKQLYDEDGDGISDRSEVFADQLTLPTGIMRWKQGVIVTDPPNLLYLEDSDGDGKSDKKEVLLTGFALSNPQHNFNTPIYGLDNWIYLANEGTYESQFFQDLFNDEGNEIRFPNHPNAETLPRNAQDLNLKVDLNNNKLAMLSGDSQHGHTFNLWGHHFGTKNWSHLYHESLASHYIDRNPYLELHNTMQYVPDYGIGFEIFPTTLNPEHQLLTDVGAITSACGITWYQGGLFPEPYQDVVFTAEPTHNLVHTDIVYDQGATFGSKVQFENKEFLASTDGWFRPVNFYIGPDGSMYLLDFYRKIIEHPEWISEEVVNSGSLYDGKDQGRIYRIVPDNSSQEIPMITLGQATTDELIGYLDHSNIWWRRNAQRLLVDGQEAADVPKIKEFIGSASAIGVVHGLWTLEGLGILDKQLLYSALGHDAAGVRENAIRLAELHKDQLTELESTLISMIDDPDAKVRFQLLCTLGYFESDQSADARMTLLFNDVEDPWVQLAALSAIRPDPLKLIDQAVNRFGNNQSEGRLSLFENLSRSVGKTENEDEINGIIGLVVMETNPKNDWWRSAVMKGLSETVPGGQQINISSTHLNGLNSLVSEKTAPEVRASALQLINSLGYLDNSSSLISLALKVANDPSCSTEFRVDAVRILAWSDADAHSQLFQELIVDGDSEPLKLAAVNALEYTSEIKDTEFLLSQWKNLSPNERDKAIDVFRSSENRQKQLLNAISVGTVQASVLGWRRTVRFLNSSNDEVRNLARSVLEGNETISDSTWLQYQEVLALDGDPVKGAEVFAQSCAMCHQISGQGGINYGPDLAAVSNRNKSGIMIDILKPNRSISDGYDLWLIEDKKGQSYSGIIANENVKSLTIRDATGKEQLIQQTDIKSRIAAEMSAMPEGLHNQISHAEMADLLEFLKN